jgi:hypothetical protein
MLIPAQVAMPDFPLRAIQVMPVSRQPVSEVLNIRGAQMLLHARCALLNCELGEYTMWSPSESSQVLAEAA